MDIVLWDRVLGAFLFAGLVFSFFRLEQAVIRTPNSRKRQIFTDLNGRCQCDPDGRAWPKKRQFKG